MNQKEIKINITNKKLLNFIRKNPECLNAFVKSKSKSKSRTSGGSRTEPEFVKQFVDGVISISGGGGEKRKKTFTLDSLLNSIKSNSQPKAKTSPEAKRQKKNELTPIDILFLLVNDIPKHYKYHENVMNSRNYKKDRLKDTTSIHKTTFSCGEYNVNNELYNSMFIYLIKTYVTILESTTFKIIENKNGETFIKQRETKFGDPLTKQLSMFQKIKIYSMNEDGKDEPVQQSKRRNIIDIESMYNYLDGIDRVATLSREEKKFYKDEYSKKIIMYEILKIYILNKDVYNSYEDFLNRIYSVIGNISLEQDKLHVLYSHLDFIVYLRHTNNNISLYFAIDIEEYPNDIIELSLKQNQLRLNRKERAKSGMNVHVIYVKHFIDGNLPHDNLSELKEILLNNGHLNNIHLTLLECENGFHYTDYTQPKGKQHYYFNNVKNIFDMYLVSQYFNCMKKIVPINPATGNKFDPNLSKFLLHIVKLWFRQQDFSTYLKKHALKLEELVEKLETSRDSTPEDCDYMK